MNSSPLEGRGILVTRPAGQAEALARLVEAAGGRAVRFPALEIEDLDCQVPALEGFDFAVFASPTAVQKFFAKRPPWPPGLSAAAVGPGTQRELQQHGVKEVLVPKGAADSEALLGLPQLQALAGKRVLLVRGEGGRELLAQTLGARGARLEQVECYRRTRPRAGGAVLAATLMRGEVDAVTLSSAEGFDNLLALLHKDACERLLRTPLFVTHQRIAAHAKAAGAAAVVIAGSGDRDLVKSLMAYF